MKTLRIITFLVVCSLCKSLQAQVVFFVSNGATVTTTGATITLNNTNLTNNGTFKDTLGTVTFIGNSNSVIGGNGTTIFNNLTFDKSANNSQLNQNIAVRANLTLISGGVSLNSGNIDFGNTGSIQNETSTNRVFGSGGYLQTTVNMNTPNSANPANLGATITSTANLGSTTIRRTHVAFTPSGNSINRAFEIIPSNNTGLNATLKMSYFDTELNGNIKANLILWKSTDTGATWNPLTSNNDTTNNFIQSTGIDSFGLFTGSSLGICLVGNTVPMLK